MSATILNTDSNINAKTVMVAENAETVTGLKTFDRDPNPPFAVSAASAVVPNLIAERASTADAPTSGQFTFPAAQNASTGANVLDDYEEGTWVPVIGGSGGTSGQTYTTQDGIYTKIGQLVIAQFVVVLSVKGVITASVQIQGLPFTANASSGSIAALQYQNLATTWVNVIAKLNASTTTATVRGTTVAAIANSTDLVTADIAATTAFVGTLIYRATA